LNSSGHDTVHCFLAFAFPGRTGEQRLRNGLGIPNLATQVFQGGRYISGAIPFESDIGVIDDALLGFDGVLEEFLTALGYVAHTDGPAAAVHDETENFKCVGAVGITDNYLI